MSRCDVCGNTTFSNRQVAEVFHIQGHLAIGYPRACLVPLPPGTRIDPNTAARDQLMQMPGIGEVIANRIIEARPFKDVHDVQNLEGVGEKTIERIAPFLQIP